MIKDINLKKKLTSAWFNQLQNIICYELEKIEIYCDLIDLRSTSPLDYNQIFKSVKRTGRLLAIDSSAKSFSIASEIIASVSMNCHSKLKCAPSRLALEDMPSPASFGLTDTYYLSAHEIALKIMNMLESDKELGKSDFDRKHPHDIPGDWFQGPF